MSNKNNQQKLFNFAIEDVFTACGIIEEFVSIPDGVDEYEATIQAWQYLIDTGACWELQGWYGRGAQALINDGTCTPRYRNKS